MTRIVGFFLALLSCCIGFSEKKSTSFSVDYTVRILCSEKRVEVGITMVGLPQSTITLKSYVQRNIMRTSDFNIYDALGNSIEATYIEENKKDMHDIFRISKWKFKAKGHKEIRFWYKVNPGADTGAERPHVVRYPMEAYGYLGRDFALLSGRNLFFLPLDEVASVKVRFIVPEGWEVVVPWPKREDGWWYPDSMESLINASIGLGMFEKTVQDVEGTSVEIAVYRGWDHRTKEKIYRTSLAIYRYMTSLFGKTPGQVYSLVFTPKTEENTNIQATSWSSGQGITMVPLTPSKWLEFAEEVFYRWNRYLPYRMEYKDRRDFWFVEGAALYYAVKALDYVGVMRADEKWAAFYKEYAMVPPHLEINLGGSYDSNAMFVQYHRRIKGALMARWLDSQIQKRTHYTQGLNDIIKFEYGKLQNLQLEKDIQQVTGMDFSGVFESYIYNPKRFQMYNTNVPNIETTRLPFNNRHDQRRDRVDRITFVITGNTGGYLENCGCRINQSGGLARLATIVKGARRANRNLVLIDVGNVFPFSEAVGTIDNVIEREIDTYMKCMEAMAYDLSGLSSNEVIYGVRLFTEKVRGLRFPFVCSNIHYRGQPIAEPYVSKTIGRYSIAFLGITQKMDRGTSLGRFEENTSDLFFESPLEAIKRALPSLKEDHHLLVIVGRLEPDGIRQIVDSIEGIDLIISTDNDYFPQFNEDNITHLHKVDNSGFLKNTLVIYATVQSYAVNKFDVMIGIDKQIKAFEASTMWLDDQIEDDRQVRSLLREFYSSVANESSHLRGTIGSLSYGDHPEFEKSKYVGVQQCRKCHQKEYDQWRSTRHSGAYNRLLFRHRHYYPECVVCHTTGFGYESGFKVEELRINLSNVQCEVCHGPGSLHAGAPKRNDAICEKPPKSLCITCHTSQHSDSFAFGKSYNRIQH